MRKIVLLLFFALGFFSLLSQTLIIREFIVSFGGNELGIGLFYFFWFIWIGMGALVALALGRFLDKHFLKLLFFYPLLSILEILLFISLRELVGISWWEFFPFQKVFLYLLLFTLPLSLFTGAIFTLGALWLRRVKEQTSSLIISSSYIFEALGSFVSGCLVTVLIAKLLSPLIILLLGSLIFAFFASLSSFCFKERPAAVLNSILFLFLLTLCLIPQKIIDFSHKLRMKYLLPEGKFLEEASTPYQHILLGELFSKVIVLSGGEVITSIPEEVYTDKEAALFISQSLAQHILIVGYGAENLISSLLKFPIKDITYCLQDKIYYEVVYKNLPLKLKKEFSTSRLKVFFACPRLFLKENKKKFDLVIVYASDPSSLVTNSFFTKEFYSLVKESLTDKGVLAARIISVEDFIGEEIRNYGSSLYYTLGEVFPKIVIIPGEINWFFASGNNSSLTKNPFILEERFRKFAPADFSFPPEGFRSLLFEERMNFTERAYRENPLFKNRKLLNCDYRPLTFFLNLLVIARYSRSFLVRLLKDAFFVGIYIILTPLLIFFIFRLIFLFKTENIRERRLLFNGKLFQLSSGFLGFSFHLVLLFLFQTKFGTIFQLIGFLNSLFMLGLCGGGILGKFLIKKLSSMKAILGILITQGVIILLTLPLFTAATAPPQFYLFIVFFLCWGILTGTSYPLSARVLEENKISLLNIASGLELLDYGGASLGGLLAGLFMLPLLGVFHTLLILFAVCFILIFLFTLEIVPFRFMQRTPQATPFPYIRTSYFLMILCLIFIINSYLLRKQETIWVKTPTRETEKDYQKTLVLESRQFAPNIKGFGGPINLRIKIDSREKIVEIRVIEHRETLSYIGDINKFLEQFKGRPLRENFSLNNNVDAISGATITSQAIVDIVNEVGRKPGVGRQDKRLIVDSASLYLALFTVLAIILHVFSPRFWALRKIYLLSVIVFLGFIFNLTFSFLHLANLLLFNLSAPRFLSQILIYFIPLTSGLLFGRLWCNWLCPFGALQEILASTPLAIKKVSSRMKKAQYVKYIFLAIFVVVISISRQVDFKVEPLSAFFLKSWGKDKMISIIVLFFSLFFSRFFCRYFCISGAFLSLFTRSRGQS